MVYDTYTGRQWLSTAEEEMAFEAGESVPIAEWEMRQPLTQTITLLGPASNVLLGAGHRAGQRADGRGRAQPLAPEAEAEGNGPALPVEVSIARTDRGFESGDQYTVVSSNTSVTELALRNASVDYPPHIVERYLQLPDNFSQRVAEDARVVTADAETVYDKARALELRLRTIEYNDAIEAPPPERDPVEYFLYDIRQGYCDYYATSMAVMLRSVGIPARVVSGYAEGSYIQEGEYQGSGYYFITEARRAHTWVEVFFPDYGWIEFEPTAGETQLNRPRGNEATSQEFPSYPQPGADSASSNPLQEEMFDPMDEPGVFGDEFSFGEEASALAHSWWLWALVTPLALAVGLWVIWRTRVAGPSQFDPNLPPILYERLQRWATRLGLRPPESDTPYEQARHLSQAVPEGRASIRAITEVYVALSFWRATLGDGWRLDGACARRGVGRLAELAARSVAGVVQQAARTAQARRTEPLPTGRQVIGE